MSDTKIIQSAAAIVNPYIFTFEDRIESGVPGVFLSREAESSAAMSQQKLREPLLTQVCNHLVNNVQLTLSTCTRCLGTGTYHDIQFDAAGQVPQLFGSDKLAQELEKIILTQSGDNRFHTEYGLPQMVDIKTKQLLTFISDRILENVSNIQQYQWDASKQNPENTVLTELINSIDSIDIVEDPIEPSRVSYKVYVRTESAQAILIQGQINLS